MSSSSTAIAYINNKGGIISKKHNKIAKEIFLWCFKNNSFISAAHMPGKRNIEEDKFSRKFYDNAEWKLNTEIYIEVTKKFGDQEIDLFVTRIDVSTTSKLSFLVL